jgi:hypothetical protein
MPRIIEGNGHQKWTSSIFFLPGYGVIVANIVAWLCKPERVKNPCYFQKTDFPRTELIEITGVGIGLLLTTYHSNSSGAANQDDAGDD